MACTSSNGRPGPGETTAATHGLHPQRDVVGARARAAVTPSVVIASERLDGENCWRMLAAGELIHVRPDLSIQSAVVITQPPARLLPLPGQNPNIDT
jgi:hypothetical protein